MCDTDWFHLTEWARTLLETLKSEDRSKANIAAISALLIKLEQSLVTKEILESTRLGGVINEIRRRIAELSPKLSKRFRNLIKGWQKVLNPDQPAAEEPPTKRAAYQQSDEPQDQEVPVVTIEDNERPPTTTALVPEKSEKRGNKGRLKGFDWLTALVPSVQEIASRVPAQIEPSEDPRKSYTIRYHDRDIICLPIVDIGVPDFLEYNYPNRDEFVLNPSNEVPF